MITIKNMRTLDGEINDFQIPSFRDQIIQAEGKLYLFPGVIDPHISLGSFTYKNWKFGLESALRGGVTTILDIPPKDSNGQGAQQKKEEVDEQLQKLQMPFQYFPYLKGNAPNTGDIAIQKNFTMGILLLFQKEDHYFDDQKWDKVFQAAAWTDLPVIVNAYQENQWESQRFIGPHENLLEKGIFYAEKHNARLYVFNVSNQEELKVIQEARKRSLLIYAETTLEHLFPKDSSKADFLWEALNKGIVDSLGSGYCVDKQMEERLLWRGGNFDFLNPIFFLPFLLTAYHAKKITVENIVRLTRVNYYDIFKLERGNNHFILVDLDKQESVQRISNHQSMDLTLQGWPVYTIIQGNIFHSPGNGYHINCLE